MKVLLVRHGETAWNVGQIRFRGQLDIELSEFGLRQATAVSRALQGEVIEVIFYSPMSRTRQTAEEIKHFQPEASFVEEPLLIDMNFGDWQGKLQSEIFASIPGAKDAWEKHPEELVFPNGESWYRVYERIDLLFKRLKRSDYNSAVLVTHETVLKIILLHHLGLAPSHFWSFRVDTASISEFFLQPDGRYEIVKVNDTHHLPPREQ